MIIAECSQNFTSLDEAKELVYLAKENGADLAKAQLFDSVKLYGFHTDTELTQEQASMLFEYGQGIGIEVFFSVFDVERVKWCEEIGVKRYKIACSQTSNLVLIDAISETGKHCFISYNNWGYSQTWLRIQGKVQLLYCVSKYPAGLEDLDVDFSRLFGADDGSYNFDGFSDHTVGLDAAKIALACGAQIIEKHFALDHQTGMDAPWSMTPDELRELSRFEKVVKQCL